MMARSLHVGGTRDAGAASRALVRVGLRALHAPVERVRYTTAGCGVSVVSGLRHPTIGRSAGTRDDRFEGGTGLAGGRCVRRQVSAPSTLRAQSIPGLSTAVSVCLVSS